MERQSVVRYRSERTSLFEWLSIFTNKAHLVSEDYFAQGFTHFLICLQSP